MDVSEYLNTHFSFTSAITEAAIKLRVSEVTVSIACMIYHSACQSLKSQGVQGIDLHLVACTSTYLASKVAEEPKKIRDVINIYHRILHKHLPPLDIGKRYWQLRDSVVQCELLLLRQIKFEVPIHSPQKYLVHFLHSLENWTNGNLLKDCRIPQIAWNLLHDSCHLPLCHKYGARKVAITAIYIASASSGGRLCPDASKRSWWEVFLPGLSESTIQEIGTQILEIYDFEEKQTKRTEPMVTNPESKMS